VAGSSPKTTSATRFLPLEKNTLDPNQRSQYHTTTTQVGAMVKMRGRIATSCIPRERREINIRRPSAWVLSVLWGTGGRFSYKTGIISRVNLNQLCENIPPSTVLSPDGSPPGTGVLWWVFGKKVFGCHNRPEIKSKRK